MCKKLKGAGWGFLVCLLCFFDPVPTQPTETEKLSHSLAQRKKLTLGNTHGWELWTTHNSGTSHALNILRGGFLFVCLFSATVDVMCGLLPRSLPKEMRLWLLSHSRKKRPQSSSHNDTLTFEHVNPFLFAIWWQKLHCITRCHRGHRVESWLNQDTKVQSEVEIIWTEMQKMVHF